MSFHTATVSTTFISKFAYYCLSGAVLLSVSVFRVVYEFSHCYCEHNVYVQICLLLFVWHSSFIAVRSLFMFFQTATVSISFVTNITSITFDPCVCSPMSSPIASIRELSLANHTFVRFLVAVCSLMCLQGGRQLIPFLADLTFIWSVACVCSLMAFQISRVCEFLFAKNALHTAYRWYCFFKNLAHNCTNINHVALYWGGPNVRPRPQGES